VAPKEAARALAHLSNFTQSIGITNDPIALAMIPAKTGVPSGRAPRRNDGLRLADRFASGGGARHRAGGAGWAAFELRL
jgi:hypothetical protein